VGRRRARFKERDATIASADVAAQVKDAAKRQALFDEARTGARQERPGDGEDEGRRLRTAVATPKIPFELRQSRELAGTHRARREGLQDGGRRLPRANQQDPRVLYLQRSPTRARATCSRAKQASGQAADWNALSPTYGYVRGKAKSMLKTADKD
jgi:hypothetical protein